MVEASVDWFKGTSMGKTWFSLEFRGFRVSCKVSFKPSHGITKHLMFFWLWNGGQSPAHGWDSMENGTKLR